MLSSKNYMDNVKISAYYNLKWESFSMEPHQHHSCEVMCVRSGKCKIFTNQEQVDLKAGQLFFLEEDVEHSLIVETSCEIMNLEFYTGDSGLEVGRLWQESREVRAFFQDSRPIKLLHDSVRAGQALRDLIVELDEGGDPYLTSLLFQRMMIEIARCSTLPTTGIGYLRKAKEYISAHYEEELRVGEVAQAVGISAAYLQTLFAQYEKGSVMDAVHAMRMEKAGFLLKNTRQTITDIAFACGYNSRQQFGYVFEKRYGKSPREYRRLAGTKSDIPQTGFKMLENRF